VKTQVLDEVDGRKTFVVVFDEGDEPVEALTGFAKEEKLSGAHFTGIGAFSSVTLGFFDQFIKDYTKIPIGEQVEVVSMVGNIVLHKDHPKVHAHVVVARRDGVALGGHLLEARVSPTLEVVVEDSTRRLRRTFDETTGLALIDLG
jgi:predicted DNA-binding protein with PD1-like motif